MARKLEIAYRTIRENAEAMIELGAQSDRFAEERDEANTKLASVETQRDDYGLGLDHFTTRTESKVIDLLDARRLQNEALRRKIDELRADLRELRKPQCETCKKRACYECAGLVVVGKPGPTVPIMNVVVNGVLTPFAVDAPPSDENEAQNRRLSEEALGNIQEALDVTPPVCRHCGHYWSLHTGERTCTFDGCECKPGNVR